MSGTSGTTWVSLLDEKKTLLSAQGCESSLAIRNEDGFRTAFESICSRYRERWSTRYLTKLLGSYGNITAFASAIGGTAQPTWSNDTTALVWAATFAVVERSCKTSAVKLSEALDLLITLNDKFPSFGADVGRFPHDAKVQSPLQDLFTAYIDLHIHITSCFKTGESPFDFDPIRQRIRDTVTQFDTEKSNYDEMRIEAEQDEARLRMRAQQNDLERKQILPNGIQDENMRSCDTSARFNYLRRLGRGSFGDVAEVKEMSTGMVYARKLIYLDGGSSTNVIEKDVLNEVTIMQKLHHQHIATVLFFIKDPHSYSIIMLPVADEDLLQYLERCSTRKYPVALTKRIYPWFGCLSDALAHAHLLNIMHRDIKPSNILIKDGQPYLTDFGVAKDFSKQDMSASGEYFVRGTPVYRAPETRPENPRGRAADIFALGAVFSEMLTVNKGRSLNDYRQWRQVPGPENSPGVFAFRGNLPKVKAWLSQLPTESDALCALLADHICSMLEEDKDKRPKAQESLNYLRRERALFCGNHC